MIFSKGNMLVVEMTKDDKAIPVINNVHFVKDGSTVGASGSGVLCVSPVNEELRKLIPLDDKKMLTSQTIASDSVRKVLKSLGSDTKFGGALDYTDLFVNKRGESVFVLTDGVRDESIEAKAYDREFADYGSILKRAVEGRSEIRSAVNLKRLVSILLTVDKICPDSTKNSIVYLEFTKENDIIIRCENVKTKQRVLGVLKAYKGAEGKWLAFGEWERKISCLVVKVVHKLKRAVRRKR